MDENVKKKSHLLLIIRIIIYVLFALFVLTATTAITFRISTRNNNGAFPLGSVEYRINVNKSMSENNRIDKETYKEYKIHEIKVDSLLKIMKIGDERKSFYDDLAVGDVLTYSYYFSNGQYAGKQVVVTDRLIEKNNDEEHAGEYILVLAGDKEEALDNKNIQTIRTFEDKASRNYVIGIVKNTNLPAGKMLTFLTSNLGIILLITTPSALLFIFELSRIIMIIRKDRVEKQNALNKQKNDEIESLKKQLEELQKEKEGKKE